MDGGTYFYNVGGFSEGISPKKGLLGLFKNCTIKKISGASYANGNPFIYFPLASGI